MPNSSNVWGDNIASRARGLNLYINRFESLYRAGHISLSDTEKIYSSAILSFYAYLENAFEQYFVGLLMGRYIPSDTSFRPLVSIPSYNVAYKVVRGARSYADWIPYKRNTLRRARVFFSSGKPFTNLQKSEYESFDHLNILRNSIAHGSSASLRSFRELFTDGKNLPPNQLHPPGYLRGQHAANQTRFNFILSNTVIAIRTLSQ